MSGTTTAIIWDVPTRRLRATWLGRYCSARTAASTRSRVAAATGRLPVSTWDTVVVLTPDARATSEMFARLVPERRTDSGSPMGTSLPRTAGAGGGKVAQTIYLSPKGPR